MHLHRRRTLPGTIRAGFVLFASSVLVGCGFFPGGTPEVIAHRAAAGRWPENSRTAVRESIRRSYPGIEVDIAITADGIPVLAHEPWLNTDTCETLDGVAVTERILVSELTLAELESEYRCGGRRDPEQPEAELVADTPMPLDELLTQIAEEPEMVLYLDTKLDPPHTVGAEEFADAIVSRLDAASVPNPVVIESTLAEGVEAFRGRGYDVALGWPRYTEDDDAIVTTVSKEFTSTLGVESVLHEAIALGADGVTLPFQLADRATLETALRQGLDVFLFTLNEELELDLFCDWPASYLMTDYPERAWCLR